MERKQIAALRSFSQEKLNKVNLFATEHSMVDLYCMLPGQSQKAHVHEASDKIFHVLEGRGTFVIGEQEEELGPGEVTIARAGEDHGLANRGSKPLVVLVVLAPRH